jgi:hypothetical protein
MHRKIAAALLSLALLLALAPALAASLPFEEGTGYSYWGRSNAIARPAGYYSTEHGPAVEHECDGHNGAIAHQLMTPAEARTLAELLEQAADAAEAE